MKNSVAVYHSLPEEARKIREEVFVREQGFQEEFDEIDGYAVHLVLFCDGTPAAVCRFQAEQAACPSALRWAKPRPKRRATYGPCPAAQA